MASNGIPKATQDGGGDGSGSHRSLPGTKRKYLFVPTDEEIVKQFGSKNPRVVDRRVNVASLMRGGATLHEIVRYVNDHIEEQNQRARALGMPETSPASYATIKKDVQYIKQSQLLMMTKFKEQRIAELFDAARINQQRAERLYLEASSFHERNQAIQTFDNTWRSMARILGLSDKVDVNVKHTQEERLRVIDGAPPQVRLAREEARMLEAEVMLDEDG